MEDVFDAGTLIRQFEDRLHRIDASSRDYASGTKPGFPLLIVYLGRESAAAHPCLWESLGNLWPRNRADLRFLRAEREDGGTAVYEQAAPGADPDGGASSRPLDRGEVSRTVSRLFGTRSNFGNYTRLAIYYLLDTTPLSGADGLSDWLDAMRELRDATGQGRWDVMEMLILLLNEDNDHLSAARDIRRAAGAFAAGEETPPKLLLLSNRRSDHRLVEDEERDLCYRAAAAGIVVSDNPDAEIAADLLKSGVMTLSYTRVEKPFSAISVYCVDALARHAATFLDAPSGDLFHDPDRLRERLGLSEDGAFTFLEEDPAIRSFLAGAVPTDEQLDLFPLEQPTGERLAYLRDLDDPAEFNRITLGAWECYLKRAMEKTRNMVRGSLPEIRRWADLYARLLRERFSARELADLSASVRKVRELMNHVRPVSPELPLREYAEAHLTRLLSSDPAIVDAMCAALEECGEQARLCLRSWERLCKSLQLCQIDEDDRNFTAIYDYPLRTYFDTHDHELRQSFRRVTRLDGLRAFFRQTMDSMFEDAALRRVLAATFEDVGARQVDETRKKLSGPGVPVYFQSGFDLGTPAYSFILLKETDSETSLYRNLRSHLPGTLFYDTGCSSSAEALSVYRVDPAIL